MKATDKNGATRGSKARMIKKREAHIVWSIDLIDRCITITENEYINRHELNNLLKQLRKEMSKL